VFTVIRRQRDGTSYIGADWLMFLRLFIGWCGGVWF
jgi:hypothetical protein